MHWCLCGPRWFLPIAVARGPRTTRLPHGLLVAGTSQQAVVPCRLTPRPALWSRPPSVLLAVARWAAWSFVTVRAPLEAVIAGFGLDPFTLALEQHA